MKKSVVEKYEFMDETSSKEKWNHDFGDLVLDFFERAVRNGQIKKTVEQLVEEIEVEFNKIEVEFNKIEANTHSNKMRRSDI